jgi:hypothetical protein
MKEIYFHSEMFNLKYLVKLNQNIKKEKNKFYIDYFSETCLSKSAEINFVVFP